MNNFMVRDDLGVEHEYTIVATANHNKEGYAIYTDYVGDGQGGLRLFVAKIIGEEQLQPIDKILEREILEEFKAECDDFRRGQEIKYEI